MFGFGLRGEKPVPPKEAVDPLRVMCAPTEFIGGDETKPCTAFCWGGGRSLGCDAVEVGGEKIVDDTADVGGL